MRMSSAVALVSALFLAAPAAAEDQEDQRVFMCLAAMGGATESDDKRLAEDALLGHFFWLGRIDPSMSETRMTELVGRTAKSINGDNIQSVLDGCSEEMNRVNDQSGRAVREMQERGLLR